MIGDIEKFGVRGTGEYTFTAEKQHPLKYSKGALAESWEITGDKVVLNIRRGVYWTGLSINPVMEKRLYTADDYVFNLRRFLDMPGGTGLRGQAWISTPYAETIYAEDDYTVVIETDFFHPEWYYQLIGIFGQQLSPETVAAGPRQWENLVGTGPFYIKDYAPGSYMIYGANPYYYRTTTVDGIEYKVPFVDEMIAPLVADEVTQVAALRTGKLDALTYVDTPYMPSLAKTNPELLNRVAGWDGSWVLFMKVDEGPPLDDVMVRRALFIGTDLLSLAKMVGHTELDYNRPIHPGTPGYIPLAELPASAQEKYDYDPTKAKQMLADAGYPDGFSLDMFVFNEWPFTADIAEMVSGMWQQIGVEVSLEVITDTATGFSRMLERDFNETMLTIGGASSLAALRSAYHSEGTANSSGYFSDEIDALIDEAFITVDEAEQAAILRELTLLVHEATMSIPFSYPPKFYYWWPWLKNYYGGGWGLHTIAYDLMWIDQTMRTDMGY